MVARWKSKEPASRNCKLTQARKVHSISETDERGNSQHGPPVLHLSTIFLIFLLPATVWAESDWRSWFSRDLRVAQSQMEQDRAALAALGEIVVGNTVPQFGYQHVQVTTTPPEAPWLQLDLGESLAMDTIALVPALVDFQPIERGAYGFPRRFRIDVSDDPAFGKFTPLLVHADEDFPPPGAAPVVISNVLTKARYLRVTVTRLAEANGTYFFALGEIMILQGWRNIALRCHVTAANSVNIAPRWNSSFVVDGLSPLGPPIHPGNLPEYDALFATKPSVEKEAWMALDFGSVQSIDEVRLHPLHARQGADVPGFRFPKKFRLEVADQADFSDARKIPESLLGEITNPGNNALVVPIRNQRGRSLRIVLEMPDTPQALDFALAEMDVYSGGKNIARAAKVSTSNDPRGRPLELLNDGFTSYGRILELPDWLAEWVERARLQRNIADQQTRISALQNEAQNRGLIVLLVGVLAIVCALLLMAWRWRRRKAQESEAFRQRLARDLHDEIGSNLAGIAVLSETAAQEPTQSAEDWMEINRIAHETSDAMREVLWLVGARQESGIDLLHHLKLSANRLLAGMEIEWSAYPDALPIQFSADARRQIFLFYKEALTNISRHARATRVTLALTLTNAALELLISDNGIGFDSTITQRGMGLKNMHDRANELHATLQLHSGAGSGTQWQLSVPLPSLPHP